MRLGVIGELDLDALVEEGRAMGAVPPESRDGLWTYNACKLSRLILRQVEERWPPAQYVSEEILRAFMHDLPSQVEMVAETGRAGEWAKYVHHFAENIRDRVARLEEYVRNPPQLHSGSN